MKHLSFLRVTTLLIMLLLCTTETIQAQTGTPEAIVASYLEATKAQDWMAVAGLVHPDDLAAFKQLFVQAIDTSTAHEDDVAFLLTMTGMTSQEDFGNMEPAQFYARFIAQVMEEQMGGVQEPGGSLDEVFQSMTFSTPTRLSETDDVVYLSVDISLLMGEEPLTYSEVMEVRRHEARWMIGITKMLQAMAFQLLPVD